MWVASTASSLQSCDREVTLVQILLVASSDQGVGFHEVAQRGLDCASYRPACPDGPNCIGPGGTVFTSMRPGHMQC